MSVHEAKEYAKSQLGNYGWGPEQFDSLEKLWNKESGWNYKAKNKKSGAAGIPQLMGGSNVPNFDNDYKLQIDRGLSYIKNRHGSPGAAWAFHQNKNWY